MKLTKYSIKCNNKYNILELKCCFVVINRLVLRQIIPPNFMINNYYSKNNISPGFSKNSNYFFSKTSAKRIVENNHLFYSPC